MIVVEHGRQNVRTNAGPGVLMGLINLLAGLSTIAAFVIGFPAAVQGYRALKRELKSEEDAIKQAASKVGLELPEE
jgi:hypothetical protein